MTDQLQSSSDTFKHDRAFFTDDKGETCRFVSDLIADPMTFSDAGKGSSTFKGLYTHKWNDFFRGEMEIKPTDLANMKRNFDQKLLSIEMAIDYGHNAFDRASGWVKNIELRNESSEIWFTVEWTPAGAKALKEKEFRYFSAEFSLNFKDENGNERGMTLIGGGLTNRPFLKNLGTVMHSQKHSQKKESDMAQNEETISLSTHKNEIKLRDEKITTLEADVAKLRGVVDSVKTLSEEVKAVKAENESLKLAAQTKEKEIAFDNLVRAGKLNIAQKKAFMENDVLALAQAFEAPNMGGATASATSGRTSDAGDAIILSEEDKAFAKRLELSEDEYKEVIRVQRSGGHKGFSIFDAKAQART